MVAYEIQKYYSIRLTFTQTQIQSFNTSENHMKTEESICATYKHKIKWRYYAIPPNSLPVKMAASNLR